MRAVNALISLLGRILIAAIFLVAGFNKIADLGGTAAYMGTAGLAPNLALPVAIFEIVAGLAILLGFLTRLFAVLLAAFCLLTALLFHNNFTDPLQASAFLKNVAIAGGLLMLFAYGNVAHSLDALRARRRVETRERVVERTPAGDRVVHDESVRHV